MVSSADFQLQQVVAAGFAAGADFSPSKALRYVMQTWSDIYDGDTTALPLGPDMPADLPVVVLSSSDGERRIEMARSRVNISWRRGDGAAGDTTQLFSDFAQKLSAIFEDGDTLVGRLGAVVTRRAEVVSPGSGLAKHFVRAKWLGGPLNRPEGFELHAHKTFELLSDVAVNSWFRAKTTKEATQVYRYVTVEQDINTLTAEQETRRFSRDDIARMFAAVSSEFDDILESYFP